MIVKRLQLSEAYNKIMEEVKTFETNLDHMTSGLNQPQQLFHCKEDLEKHIQSLKVSAFRVGLSWQKSEWKWKEKGKGIALFALNVRLMGMIF